jgi:hypothetical protein
MTGYPTPAAVAKINQRREAIKRRDQGDETLADIGEMPVRWLRCYCH